MTDRDSRAAVPVSVPVPVPVPISSDGRWQLLARQLIVGTAVVEGSSVAIFMTDPVVMPAVEAFVEECYRIGALPQVLSTDERFDSLALKFAPAVVLAQPGALELMSMEWADVHVSFRAMIAPPTESLSAEMEARLALQRVGKGEVSRSRWENTRWCLVRVPTPEWAALIDEPFDVLLDEFFGGCLTEWASVKPRWDELCTQLSLTSSIRILSADTDLTFGVGGRTWVSFAGEANLPDGEVATAPRETEVNGYITFSGSFWFAGVEVRDLRLEFVAGLVTTVAATRGAAFVEKLLDSDEGARRVGELGIGTNRLVRTVTGDLLIDEKILGSAHFALGRSYPQCGGLNLSSLHWDIVKDLRFSDCFVYADGVELIAGGVPVGILDAATRSL